jgi:hypothetical protein
MVQFAPPVRSLPSDEESDAIETLGDEIAILAAHIHAAAHRLLVLLEEFDRRSGWEREGHSSCAHWLAFRTGIDLGSAREKVRAARALLGLPRTSAAMARGELSFSQVRGRILGVKMSGISKRQKPFVFRLGGDHQKSHGPECTRC